jgi:hypothetical protein
VVLLLLLLAAAVASLFSFERFRADVNASNRRVPAATRRALAPAGDVLKQPQVVLIVFDRASLFARVDPPRRAISLLSVPSGAYLRRPGGMTVGRVLKAGAAGLVRFAGAYLHLRVTHVALLRTADIGPLVDAVGGIAIEDIAASRGTQLLDGPAAQRYIAAAAAPSLARRERERAVLEGVIDRLASVASLSRLPLLARTFSATVATDLSPRDSLALALVRLRSKLSIQCGVPEEAVLSNAGTLRVLRQFEGAIPLQRAPERTFPTNGCQATALSVRAPAALVFFGKQALALFPFMRELGAAAIALDLILLSVLLGMPQALLGLIIGRRPTPSLPGRGGDAELDAALLLRVPRDNSEEPISAYAGIRERSSPLPGAVQPSIQTDVALQRSPEQTSPAVSGGAAAPTQRTRRFEGLTAALMFLVARGGLREHADAAWLAVGAAAAIAFGYLIARFGGAL